MISFIWRTDVHFASESPASRKDDWQAAVTDKLQQVGRLAAEHKAVAVLDGGDFFHVKAPTRTPHSLVEAVGRIHAEYPCPVYANVGNHDLSHDNLNTLPKQPLGVLFAHGTFRRLEDETFIDDDGLKVRVVGFPFKRLWSIEDFNIERGDEDYLVVCLHLLASKVGGQMFEGEAILSYKDIPTVFPDADVLLVGHWHQDQGITRIEETETIIVNTGSLTRGALTEDEMTRIPKAVSLLFRKGVPPKVKTHPLRVVPAEEVFDVEARERKKVEEKQIEAFVHDLQKQSVDMGEVDLSDTIRGLDFAQRVKDRAIGYLQEVS